MRHVIDILVARGRIIDVIPKTHALKQAVSILR